MTHRTKLAGYFRWTLWLFLMALFLIPQSARGQEAKLDLSADYSYLRANSSGGGGSFNSQGGNVTGTWNWKPWLGVAGDVAGYNFGGQPPGVKGRLFTYTAGPRLCSRSERTRWVFFAHALAGYAHLSGSVNDQSAHALAGYAHLSGSVNDKSAHALAGYAHLSGSVDDQSASANGFALIAGGGADWRVFPGLAVRVFEADYLMTRVTRLTNTPGIQNDVRLSAGLVVYFGRR